MIAWEVPPDEYNLPARSIWRRTTRELKANPGVWALVCEDESPAYARSSCARLLRTYGCETRTRTTTDNGLISVWARWPESNACSANVWGEKNAPRTADTAGEQATPGTSGGDMRDDTRPASVV